MIMPLILFAVITLLIIKILIPEKLESNYKFSRGDICWFYDENDENDENDDKIKKLKVRCRLSGWTYDDWEQYNCIRVKEDREYNQLPLD